MINILHKNSVLFLILRLISKLAIVEFICGLHSNAYDRKGLFVGFFVSVLVLYFAIRKCHKGSKGILTIIACIFSFVH